jgi:hypothetical protein
MLFLLLYEAPFSTRQLCRKSGVHGGCLQKQQAGCAILD